MTVLLVHQGDAEATERTAQILSGDGHAVRTISETDLSGEGAADDSPDLVIVFSEMYREEATLGLCRRIRASERFGHAPLLAAVSMYQMPLANRIKSMSGAHFIFAPVEPDDLRARIEMMTEAAEGGSESDDEGAEEA